MAGEQYWGHVDNDMILGNVRKFLTSEVLANDVVSGLNHKNAWGPITVFRNEPKVNLMFHHAPELCAMLGDPEPWGFDEKFGRNGTNMHEVIGNVR